MPTRVLLTVDTELRWGPYLNKAGWEENLALSFDPAGVGVPYQLEMLRRRDLKACFFVDPMPAVLYGLDPVRRMVEPILEAGQEVQLHLHSAWAEIVRRPDREARFELTGFDADEQFELLAEARDLLVAAGAPSPIAFRAGAFAANADTLAGLKRLGISYDSSHNGAEHPHVSELPLDAGLIDPAECGGIVEIPVTQIRRPDGGLRPFQLCALSGQEMRHALRHASDNDHPVVTIVSHSFELASRDSNRVNGLVRSRFDGLCAFLDRNRDSMPTASFADLEGVRASVPSKPMPASRSRTLTRTVQQAWGTARYEQPLTAAIFGAPPFGILTYAALAEL
jgi:peptidoglycan/xylan/chitin deacetylase (PgdA/CDA1 family)